MKIKLFLSAAALALTTALATPAKAEMTALEIVFVKADKNGDLVLSKGEVLLVAIGHFGEADSDRDNKLEKNEVSDLAKHAEFADNDTDKDGALSIEEVIEEKLADFKDADTDKSGSLTVDEVKTFYDKQKK